MKKVKIKFIENYLVYPKGQELSTTISNAEKLKEKGVIEILEKTEKPKRGRKPKNKAELKDSIETK